MSSKKSNGPVKRANVSEKQPVAVVPGGAVPAKESKYLKYVLAIGVAIITFLVFRDCLDNQFVSWDDPGYVTKNSLLTRFPGNLGEIFSTAVMGNYHPLTMLSLAIEYSIVKLEPWLYHFDSVLLHIVNTALVFWLVLLLLKRPAAAAVAALLFGIHPMHVESVAWISARKDVLYGAFYLSAIIAYVYYLRRERNKLYYTLTILLFVASVLSKPVAVVVPLTLLLVDYLEQKPLKQAVLEKLPFFIIALVFGLKSIHDQNQLGVVSKLNDHFNIIDTITMGCYTLGTYLWKAVLPLNLSCFYPYPSKNGNLFPVEYYIYPFAVAAIVFLIWKLGRRNRRVVFGSLFFLVNIALLLQFVPVGNALIAERYSYMAYLGLFFIAAAVVARSLDSVAPAKKWLAPGLVLVACAIYGYESNARCKVWHDSDALWGDQLVKHPENEYAYNNLGFEYFTRWKSARSAEEDKMLYDSAQYYLNTAVSIKPDFVNPHLTLGIMARVMKNYDEAKSHFYKATVLANGSEKHNAYLGLGILYFITRQMDSSAYYLQAAIKLKPDLQEAHANYANILDMMDKNDEALKEYNLSIKLAPGSYESYLNRGRLLLRIKRNAEAGSDFNKALELNPQSGEAYNARAYYYWKMGNNAQAIKDEENAILYGYKDIDRDMYESLLQTAQQQQQ